MPVLNESGFSKAALPSQKIEEARNQVGEWLRHGLSGVIRGENYTKQLLDWIADAARGGLALGFRVLASLASQPCLNKRFNIGRKFLPGLRAIPVRKLSEPEQNGHASKNIPSSVVLLAKPYDVTLDRLANPRCTDTVDGSRANEISIQHDNLLSAREAQEIIALSRNCYVPSGRLIARHRCDPSLVGHITEAGTLHGLCSREHNPCEKYTMCCGWPST
jgi:hypothetical protein